MRALVAAALLAAAPAHAAQWRVDPAKSSIAFESAQAGAAVAGRFTRWTAAIDFDPAKPQAAKVTVTVDLASARTGNGAVDGQLPTADWFNVASGPRATFATTAVTATGPGRYLARGRLTMRGVAVPVELPFTLGIQGDVATMRGQTRLDRRALKLGLEADGSAAWVPFAVPVRVTVVARRAP